MFDYDHEARRQLSRERVEALAQDYRRAQPLSGGRWELPERSRSRVMRTLSLLGQLRRQRAGHVPA
jgi:hypothetical protein